VELIITHEWTEWLTLDQLRQLLTTGKLEVQSPGGKLRLYVNDADRVTAQELIKP